MNENNPVPRRTERRPVELSAQCRTQSGLRDKGTVSDMSPEGCCVTTNALFTRVGLRVMIKPEGMEGLSGVIRWIEGNKAGVQFDSPLYGPVFDHMCDTHQTGRPVSFARF